jgi:hypothetical protein
MNDIRVLEQTESYNILELDFQQLVERQRYIFVHSHFSSYSSAILVFSQRLR